MQNKLGILKNYSVSCWDGACSQFFRIECLTRALSTLAFCLDQNFPVAHVLGSDATGGIMSMPTIAYLMYRPIFMLIHILCVQYLCRLRAAVGT